MKRTILLITALCFINFFVVAQDINHKVVDEKGTPKLLGKVDKVGLLADPFNAWFQKNYDAYLTHNELIKKFEDELKHYNIKVFLGTWCGDSKREVPRFYKVLEAANFPLSQLDVYAADNTTETYKQTPDKAEEGLNIHRVPTFIFYKEGTEINRIVEEPVETLERDILNIVSEKRYSPTYNAANYLGNLLNEQPLDRLHQDFEMLRDVLSDRVKHSGELNTLGYVLLRAKEIDKALFVFKVNKAIFPYKANTIDSYAEALYEKKEYTEALKNYYKVLSLSPNDSNAQEMISKINTLTYKKRR